MANAVSPAPAPRTVAAASTHTTGSSLPVRSQGSAGDHADRRCSSTSTRRGSAPTATVVTAGPTPNQAPTVKVANIVEATDPARTAGADCRSTAVSISTASATPVINVRADNSEDEGTMIVAQASRPAASTKAPSPTRRVVEALATEAIMSSPVGGISSAVISAAAVRLRKPSVLRAPIVVGSRPSCGARKTTLIRDKRKVAEQRPASGLGRCWSRTCSDRGFGVLSRSCGRPGAKALWIRGTGALGHTLFTFPVQRVGEW